MEITYKPFGKKAILIEWKSIISEVVLNDILNFKLKIEKSNNSFFSDLIIGYNSLTVLFQSEYRDFSVEVNKLKTLYNSTFKKEKKQNYLWEIPVCYDISFGIDLNEIATKKGCSIEEIVQFHSNKLYTVFFIGFLPGFMYLGGLDERIFFDRKPNPRLKVAKGSVGIGGKQTGIYPSNSAGGWNIIGNTPIVFFDIKNKYPCFTKAGDKIKFVSISLNEYNRIEKRIKQDDYHISKTLLDD